jgi:hypothetical protein
VEGLRSLNTRLAATNPELAQQINSTVAAFAGRLSELPSVFGYSELRATCIVDGRRCWSSLYLRSVSSWAACALLLLLWAMAVLLVYIPVCTLTACQLSLLITHVWSVMCSHSTTHPPACHLRPHPLLPAPLGGNAWSIATSGAVNDQYRATLEHCYRDLYWCWENAGLGGDLMLELTSNWEALTEPLRARWEATITGLVDTWTALQGE